MAAEVFAETKSPKISLRALKVAATYSPTTSAVPSAWLGVGRLCRLSAPSSAPARIPPPALRL
ncbi:MAG: hypothetical protein MR787_03690 [Bacteroidales bacterium]|nr:hypothetical protein [Bacteroidales bacterium]